MLSLLVVHILVQLGWQDVGYRPNTDVKDATPFIDSLAAEGVKLDAHYVQPVCTPTRGCFLTGRYALKLGFQTGVLSSHSLLRAHSLISQPANQLHTLQTLVP